MAMQEISGSASDAPGAKTTVLFVDDERELLDVYELLCGPEYEVITASDGTESLELFGEHIDFAFFDRRMPGLSGDEAIANLREQGYDTPMGIISAVDPDVESDLECDVYLTKPVGLEDIQTTVKQHID